MPQAPLKKEENYEEYLEAEKLIKLTFNSLQLFTAELLVTTLTPEALQNIIDVSTKAERWSSVFVLLLINLILQ